MNSIGKVFEFLRVLVLHPKAIGAMLHENTWWKKKFARSAGHTNPLRVVEFSTLVPESLTLDNALMLGGGSLISDLMLLRALAMRDTISVYFEIGSWRGESMLAVLPYVDKAYSFDLDTSKAGGHATDPQWRKQQRVLLQNAEKVSRIDADSKDFDFAGSGIKADLIFIDGNHSYQYVVSDTVNMLKHIAHDKSIVVWHDYGEDPEFVHWEVYKGIFDAVPTELHSSLFHVSNTKCAVLLRENIPSTPAKFPQDVVDLWEVTIRKKLG